MTGSAGLESAPDFARARHSFLALVASALFLGLHEFGLDLLREALWPGEQASKAMAAALDNTVRLLFVVVPLWLALVAFDTRSDVRFWPRRWQTLGAAPVWLVAGVLLFQITVTLSISPEVHLEWAKKSYGLFFDHAGFSTTWFVVNTVMGVTAEEILFRALLQRAFEGYMAPAWAVLAQALLFQLAHTVLYGYDFSLYHGICGVIFGIAFMRTRSIAAPLLLHLVVNTGHVMLVTRGAASMF